VRHAFGVDGGSFGLIRQSPRSVEELAPRERSLSSEQMGADAVCQTYAVCAMLRCTAANQNHGGGGLWPRSLVMMAAHAILPSHSAPHAELPVPCAPQYHGNCDAGPGCGLSHDLDLIVDIHENPGKWRKRKRGEDTPAPTPAPDPGAAGALDAGTGGVGDGATGKDSRSKKRRLRRRLMAGATHGMCARRPLSALPVRRPGFNAIAAGTVPAGETDAPADSALEAGGTGPATNGMKHSPTLHAR
jgi:hypothetical protein